MPDDYTQPGADVSFGDIFDAQFLHDVFLRADAVAMGTRSVKGGALAYSPTFASNREYVLARGAPYRAILVTDNCVIDTALGQGEGREDSGPKGRLLFAPITPASEDDMSTMTFGRFPLPAWPDRFGDGIAELRRCFMVDSRAVADNKGARAGTLGEALVDGLELRWNAYAARRGPMASARNAEKLAGFMARLNDREDPDAAEEALGLAVAEAFALAWRAEGRDLAATAAAYDDQATERDSIDALEGGLRELAESAARAADGLADQRPQ